MASRKRKKTSRRPGGGRTNPACDGCPALCCHDLVQPILKPRTRADVEELKWQLHYDTVSVFIANRRWHLKAEGRCQYLDDANLCTIYDRRPEKCRRHSPPDCERYGSYYDVMIQTPEELDAYVAREKARARRRRRSR